MSQALRARLERLELAQASRVRVADDPRRRWVALNLAVAVATRGDPAPWLESLAEFPPTPPGPRAILSATERVERLLALLCRESRERREYRTLLALAVGAGLANDRQAAWIEEAGLLSG